MVSTRTSVVAVSIMVVLIAQTYGEITDLEWAKPIQDTVKNLTSVLSSSNNSEIIESAKSKLLGFVGKFKENAEEFGLNIQNHTDATEALKEAVKNFKTKVESYTVPVIESNANKVSEGYEYGVKWIATQATELSKLAQGSSADPYIRTWAKKEIDDLVANIKSVADKVNGKSA
ncbi:uncharacterized protein LOC126844509 [Adelges cooleyi]|uniref:uncharacterized protein LOC126844509 n=1 Tax=Adelges cooleyi TaxID=133065 RepID=UPI00217FD3A4|nr:uncharacterized protein LOC126844509 [Adelges cooleyi]